MIKTHIKSVSLSDIDINDDTYRITRMSNIDALAESIKDIGIINLPMVEKTSGGFRIVCGFKRIQACGILDVLEIPCKIVDHSSSSTRIDCLKIAIADNTTTVRSNLLEEARAIVKLSELCDDKDELPRIANALGIQVNRDLVEKYRRLCMLPDRIQQFVGNDIFSLKIAIELDKLDSESAYAIADLFDSTRPTSGQQRELIANLKAISAIQNTSVSKLLASSPIQDVLEMNTLDRKQKIQLLRYQVKKLRYPYITSFESRYYTNLQQLNLPNGMTLVPPRDFESPVYTFSVDFVDTDELKHKADCLVQLSKSNELMAILNRKIEN